MTFKIGTWYWNFRGLIEPIQLVLEYLEFPYEITKYEYSQAGEWFDKDKKNLGLEMPNMPYLIKGDFKLTQSAAILKYLGRIGGLYPSSGSDEEMAKIDEIMETLLDFRLKFVLLCINPDFDNIKAGYFKSLPTFLDLFENRLSDGRKWLKGDHIFVGDFQFWTTLDFHECMEPNVFEKYPKIKQFKNDFESIPQIARYLASDKFRKFPINGRPAKWGIGKE
ncbi:glutathione S-transferase class-mu 26 kDa isozyme 51-like [Convolutriloba macropyga]|uniref:glutathione S-transferase class-mu 26 kDa isozyme 51-like n=1 Tax=Convolutriloba macropyga TaxID=536237 RepID=UPI003F51ED32